MISVSRILSHNLSALQQLADRFLNNETEQTTTNHLSSIVHDNRTFLFVATTEGQVIGYTLIYTFPGFFPAAKLAYLYDIEVEQAFRKQGAGRMMIETALTALKAEGVSELWLGTGTKNTAGQMLFTNTGAVRSDETFIDFTYEL